MRGDPCKPSVSRTDTSSYSAPEKVERGRLKNNTPRRDDNRHSVNRESEAALFGRECVDEDGLFTGAHTSAASALKDAEKDQQRQRRRQPAENGRRGEQRDAGHVEPLASDDRGEPARHRQHG